MAALSNPYVGRRLVRHEGTAWLLRIGLLIETVVHVVLALTTNPWVAG